MSKAIPDRWLPYSPCGTVIEGTRIICFKVPLNKTLQHKFKSKWDIETLLKKISNLGAVIDLTNTNRYYNPSELKNAGILYKKILIPGRMIPPNDKVTEFFKTLDGFLSRDSEKLVGVHCTHGLNRTGYMVCRYMRDRLCVPPKQAIAQFEKARGYHIERENYIADLLGKKPLPPSLGPDTIVKPINASGSGGKLLKKKYPYKSLESTSTNWRSGTKNPRENLNSLDVDVPANWRQRDPPSYSDPPHTIYDGYAVYNNEKFQRIGNSRGRYTNYSMNEYRNNYINNFRTRSSNYSDYNRNEYNNCGNRNSYNNVEGWQSTTEDSRDIPSPTGSTDRYQSDDYDYARDY